MKKIRYSKKQIKESIARWKKILESMSECGEVDGVDELSETERLTEARDRAIGDACDAIFRTVQRQLKVEAAEAKKEYDEAEAKYRAKRADISKRRQEAWQKFLAARNQLKGISDPTAQSAADAFDAAADELENMNLDDPNV